jgi:hypothetical protein
MKQSIRLILSALLLSGTALAGTVYQVSLNTNPLVGHAAGPFYVDLQLIGTLGNTATVDGFDFGGGAPDGDPSLTGGASGSLTAGFRLTTDPVVDPGAAFFNEAYAPFVPGDSLSFVLTLDIPNPPSPADAPDSFSFAILDGSLSEIPTNGGSGALVQVDFTDPGNPSRAVFSNDPTTSPVACAPDCSPIGPIDAPLVGTVSEAAPEPRTWLLALPALLAAILVRRFRPYVPYR